MARSGEPIILASKSPRRRELFSLITPNYECAAPPADESGALSKDARELSLELARRKCLAAAAAYPERVVVGCDTVVCLESGEVLGKPRDAADARRMLGLLSGAKHSVFTGVCVALGGREADAFACRTVVSFYKMSARDIEEYIATNEPFDKAGGYGAQGAAAKFIEGIEGDYFNVVGLPVSRVYRSLRALGAL